MGLQLANESKNRYAQAPRQADWTIDQNWASYSDEEHDRWNRLFARQATLLPGRACDEFLAAKQQLELSRSGIPEFADLSRRLGAMTGWSVVPVAGLIPDDAFFDHLANRRFPAGAFIRPESELEYLQEPDVFHDVFGHVPLLANPTYARFLEAYGKGIEFGLIETAKGLRIFGAGIMSSPSETIFSLEDSSPNRVAFDLERVMRTNYIISDFQQTYFVIESFEKLLADGYQDFDPIYDRLRNASDFAAHELTPGDRIISRGDFHYFRAKHSA
ncbi:MAG: hypothetical protein FD172_2133 [Methylocystaceae bacterium]|nr:MAG: hypothetical protein FD172_2133 [Methylocystaceae bacterium]